MRNTLNVLAVEKWPHMLNMFQIRQLFGEKKLHHVE